jgi:hypothetical protein
MKMQLWVSSGILAVVMTLAVMASSSSLDAQGAPRATSAASGDRSALRTPWGSADLQGTWTSEGELGVPFERPAQFGDRQYLTEQEYADRLRQTQLRDQEALAEIDVFTADVSNAGAVGSPTSPPPHWLERSTQSRRTSLVIDPPNGRIPALTQTPARGGGGGGRRGGGPGRGRNSAADFSLYDRCITRGLPGAIFPAIYNANTRIVQGPDSVAITYEMIHETRVVSLDDRTRPPAFRQMQGNSHGRWDGDTLVVETTGLLEGMAYRGGSRNQRLIERFRRVDAETLRYELTVIDPETWTAPWTVALDLKPQPSGMYEYACHEGNYAMRNMLSALRAEEAAAAKSGGR